MRVRALYRLCRHPIFPRLLRGGIRGVEKKKADIDVSYYRHFLCACVRACVRACVSRSLWPPPNFLPPSASHSLNSLLLLLPKTQSLGLTLTRGRTQKRHRLLCSRKSRPGVDVGSDLGDVRHNQESLDCGWFLGFNAILYRSSLPDSDEHRHCDKCFRLYTVFSDCNNNLCIMQ